MRKLLAEAEAEKQAVLQEDNLSQFDALSEHVNLFKEGLNAIVDPDHKFVSIQYLAENGERKQIKVRIGER